MNEILGAAADAKVSPTRQASAPVRRRTGAHQQLATAPRLQGGIAMQLAGGAALPAFPAMSAAAPEALLHWGNRPGGAAAAGASPMGTLQPGWFVPAAPAYAMPVHGMMPQHRFYMGPQGQAVPVPAQAPTVSQCCKQPQLDGTADAAALEAGSPTAAGAGEEHGQQEQAPGGEGVLAEEEGDAGQAHPDVHAAALNSTQPQAYDAAASWPPYEGAKLPSLYQVGVGGGGEAGSMAWSGECLLLSWAATHPAWPVPASNHFSWLLSPSMPAGAARWRGPHPCHPLRRHLLRGAAQPPRACPAGPAPRVGPRPACRPRLAGPRLRYGAARRRPLGRPAWAVPGRGASRMGQRLGRLCTGRRCRPSRTAGGAVLPAAAAGRCGAVLPAAGGVRAGVRPAGAVL